jgi:transposase
VADNAGAHKSRHTQMVLSLLDISRIAWPPQSPDLNPIEHCWDYIRAQIKKRKHVPTTDNEVIQLGRKNGLKYPKNALIFGLSTSKSNYTKS